MDAKKLKLIVKGERKPTFGTDPNEPWSVRAGITESEKGMLHDYLKSRGINPDFVGKDTKISHAKSAEFHKWKRDHMFDDPINYVSTVAADKMKKLRAQREEVEIEEMKTLKLTPVEMRQKALNRAKRLTSVVSHNGLHKEGFDDHEEIAKELIRRHGMNVTKNHLKALENERDSRGALDHDAVMAKVRAMGAMTEAKTIQGTALDKFRQAAAERAKKHADIEAKRQADAKQGKEDMKGAIDRLEKHLNKEAADAGISKAKETSFHKKLDKLVHSTFGKRKDEMKMKEESEHKVGDSVTVNSKFFGKQKGKVTKIDNQSIHVQRNDKKTSEKYPHDAVVKEEAEQIDELNYDTVKSLYKKRRDDFHGDQVGKKKKGKEVSAKNVSRSISRLMGSKPTQKEDVFHDTLAATQMPFDMANQADDREPTYSKRKEMSKSARIIKSLYKKHKMVKEELYDHEKEDKSIATYGKKPKVEKQEVYDDDSEAAMVLKGGTTMTGQTRDTVEIDPVMRKANKNNDNQRDK